MDFSQREASQTPNRVPAAAPGSSSRRKFREAPWLKWSFVGLLFSATIVVVGLIAFLVMGGPNSESKFVGKDDFQAVFLNNGQVYFGHVKDLNDKFVRIQNIYYLRQTQSPQPDQNANNNSNNLSLVKLGCEVHAPTDEMLVNRDQVSFWENLKSDGQVAKAINDFVKQNPDGQKCNTT